MPKPTRTRPFGRRSGTVTVIEDRVYRSQVRTAKIAFWVVLVTVGLAAAVVAADHWSPVVALVVGALVGTGAGLVVAAVVVAWPIIRAIWWWFPEITGAGAVGVGWVELATHTALVTRLVVVALVVGVPAAVPPVRRRILAVAWCLVSRHRLRTCFAQFILANRTGALPLILWARPIPVGEQVWVWLRPGLSVADLEGRLDKIAAACWAATVTVEKASASNAALVRLDVKRRDALTGPVPSPLVDLVTPDVPAITSEPGVVPTALDLPDVAPDVVATLPKQRTAKAGADKKPAHPVPEPEPAPAVAGPGGDDLADWIA